MNWRRIIGCWAGSSWLISGRRLAGEPQVEVTFDVDANGILNVTARDKDTGKEQGITISEGSNLDAKEVERMIAEAESHRKRGRADRERIDTSTSSMRWPTAFSGR